MTQDQDPRDWEKREKFENIVSSTYQGKVAWSEDSRIKLQSLWSRKVCLRDYRETRYPDNNTQKNLTLELAIFFDEAAYHKYIHVLDNNKEKLRNMILAYVNQIQSAFHHPSLGSFINISLVRLDIMEKQPPNLSVFDGNVDKILNSFCNYAKSVNPLDDNDPHHWDVGLYLTGIDLYEAFVKEPVTYGKLPHTGKSHATTGLTYFGQVCNLHYSCAIAEFGYVSDSLFNGFLGFASSFSSVYLIGLL